MKLKPELGLFSLTLYGIGVILGAGVYALIGVGAGLAGNMLWLAFLISAVIAMFTGLSYAELSSMFPKEAAEYNYTRKAFSSELFSFTVGWLLAAGTIIAAAAVALGFGGYFFSVFGIEQKLGAAALIIVMALINLIGIKESALFNNFASIIEAAGLLIVVAVVFLFAPEMEFDLLEAPPGGFSGIIAAVSVVFFAYIGFESIANVAEEVKDKRRNLPRAMILSLVIATVLYMLVALASVMEVGAEALSESDAPLTLAVSRVLGPYAAVLSFIALFATGNTVLIMLIASSRMLYGMSKGGSFPKIFSSIGSTRTPWFAIIVAAIGALLVMLASDIKTVAQLTDISIFMAYLAVNVSLIVLARKPGKRGFTSPRLFGHPVLAYIGALTTFLMLISFEPALWVLELGFVVLGLVIFMVTKNGQARKRLKT